MVNKSVLSLTLSLVLASFGVAVADPDFSFTAPGGLIPVSGTEGIAVFPLTMNPAHSDLAPAPPYPMPGISSLELVLTGLTHTDAGDLDIYLIDPFGKTLEIMTDRGIGAAINANLVFTDSATELPVLNGQIVSGTYLPEGVPGFSEYNGGSGGTDAWILLIIDDSMDDQGALTSFTLRGTYVPEPVTLSLLALGALTFLRRRRA